MLLSLRSNKYAFCIVLVVGLLFHMAGAAHAKSAKQHYLAGKEKMANDDYEGAAQDFLAAVCESMLSHSATV